MRNFAEHLGSSTALSSLPAAGSSGDGAGSAWRHGGVGEVGASGMLPRKRSSAVYQRCKYVYREIICVEKGINHLDTKNNHAVIRRK